jgi:CxxH/CxxC protein (TIGR04129 family)
MFEFENSGYFLRRVKWDMAGQKTLLGTADDGPIYKKVTDTGKELPVFTVCIEHVEQAIDTYVNDYGQPPDLYRLDTVRFADWQPSETCVICKGKAVLLIV